MAQTFTQSFERDGEMGKCMQEALLSQQLPEPMPCFLDSDESVADDDGWGKLMDTTKFLSLDSDDDKSTTPTEDLNGSRTMNGTVGKWNEKVDNKVSQGPESMTLGLEDLYAVEASAF